MRYFYPEDVAQELYRLLTSRLSVFLYGVLTGSLAAVYLVLYVLVELVRDHAA